jgi:hypothetical protein
MWRASHLTRGTTLHGRCHTRLFSNENKIVMNSFMPGSKTKDLEWGFPRIWFLCSTLTLRTLNGAFREFGSFARLSPHHELGFLTLGMLGPSFTQNHSPLIFWQGPQMTGASGNLGPRLNSAPALYPGPSFTERPHSRSLESSLHILDYTGRIRSRESLTRQTRWATVES